MVSIFELERKSGQVWYEYRTLVLEWGREDATCIGAIVAMEPINGTYLAREWSISMELSTCMYLNKNGIYQWLSYTHSEFINNGIFTMPRFDTKAFTGC